MSPADLQSDIDYMKSLAVAGGSGPMKNGATLFWAGLLYGLAAAAQYAMVVGILPRSQALALGIWFGASIVFGIIAFAFRASRSRVAGSVSNRAANSAWSAVGIGIIAFIGCLAIVSSTLHSFEPVSYLVAPVILLLYGMGWWVSALMSGTNWLKLISLGCFLGAPAISFLAGKPEQLLAYAGCLFLFAMVPGFVLMRAEKA